MGTDQVLEKKGIFSTDAFKAFEAIEKHSVAIEVVETVLNIAALSYISEKEGDKDDPSWVAGYSQPRRPTARERARGRASTRSHAPSRRGSRTPSRTSSGVTTPRRGTPISRSRSPSVSRIPLSPK